MTTRPASPRAGDLAHVGASESRDVIDDAGASVDACLGDRCMSRVDAHRDAMRRELAHDGQDAGDFDLGRHLFGTGTSRLSTHIDDVRAGGD